MGQWVHTVNRSMKPCDWAWTHTWTWAPPSQNRKHNEGPLFNLHMSLLSLTLCETSPHVSPLIHKNVMYDVVRIRLWFFLITHLFCAIVNINVWTLIVWTLFLRDFTATEMEISRVLASLRYKVNEIPPCVHVSLVFGPISIRVHWLFIKVLIMVIKSPGCSQWIFT